MRALVVMLLLAVSSASCKGLLKKREPDPSASQAPAAPPIPVAAPVPTPAAVAEPAPAADDNIPTPEDFEDEAFEKVTQATYNAELERLKKDIAK